MTVDLTMDSAIDDTLERAQALIKVEPAKAAALYHKVLAYEGSGELTDDIVKPKETAMIELARLYASEKQPREIIALLKQSRSFLALMSKAKTAKIIRDLVNSLMPFPEVREEQVAVCKDFIEWSVQEKRQYLKQALEARLIEIYLLNNQYSDALTLSSTLLRELKRLDDKLLMVEVFLLESKVCFEIKNFPKSRASLTAARSAANSVYCPPLMQASLDMQSGILHAVDKDYKTSYSYFYETMEGYTSLDDPRSADAFKYMLLCKIMLKTPTDVFSLVSGKMALKYTGRHIDAMVAVAKASQNRSLKEFEKVLNDYPDELRGDDIVRSHLDDMYDQLLDQNLARIIEPFSKVEVTHVAKLIDLPAKLVETKLSQMILDKKFHGVLDQGAGCLIVFDDAIEDGIYGSSLETMNHLGGVVDALFQKSRHLS
eukprot:NODE_470_length_1463_cov_100.042665_g437_i0.p1 GENE.NODE_470_length_1463_cov_100.042665_g437_i0~~NODE_470_length_1463_cov_100.042665_g437_i0.p1  ORF type:complete len:429 (-),score=91.20 NODE_470_length_1463_cov_100.042665_g437_i0:53-1339(-)